MAAKRSRRRCLRCHQSFEGTSKRKYCYVTNCVPVDNGGGVYFILSQGFVKIGMSIFIKSRLAEIQRSHPLPLTLLGVIPLPQHMQREQELALHFQFAALRTSGEWFKLDQSILEYIRVHAKDVHPMVEELLTDHHNQAVA